MRRESEVAQTATAGLRLLWKAGVFKVWKSYPQIVECFAKDGYNFPPSELGMALQRAKFLTRRGKRMKYEYIQKHPFVHEGEKK